MSRYVLVDVFTDTPLEGNQLAVFPDARGLSNQHMQRLAREMNLSETAFLLPVEGEADARMRIFTPRRELPFAAHPVLGCAFVLGEALDLDKVSLETGLGIVPVELERDNGRIAFGWMRFAS
jgi:trans-2,3-dihydro-3-hydroxyanthranilate isomerase